MRAPNSRKGSVEISPGGSTRIGSGPQMKPTELATIRDTARVEMIQPWPWTERLRMGETAILSVSSPIRPTTSAVAGRTTIQGSPRVVAAVAATIAPNMTRSPWAKLNTLVGR